MSDGPAIPTADPNDPASAEVLARARQRLGRLPNVLRTAAHSPVAVRSLWGLMEMAGEMRLPDRTQQAIALRVAQLHDSAYCLAAHGAAARIDLDDAETLGFRQGRSHDPKEQALLALATKLVTQHGHGARLVIDSARELGVSDEELVDVVALVAFHTFTNCLTVLANTAIDFPLLEDLEEQESRQRARRSHGD